MPSSVTYFKPGQSGNPGGRPKNVSITSEVRKLLKQPLHAETKVTNAQMAAAQVVSKAVTGDLEALKLVWSYMDGSPPRELKIDNDIDIRVSIDAVRKALEIAS